MPERAADGVNFAEWIGFNARSAPDKIALRFEQQTLSYGAFALRIEEIAAALAAKGVLPGDCVAWLGLNSAMMLGTLFACARLGAIFMPLNWRLAPPEHRAMLLACAPTVVCVDACFADASAEYRVAGAAMVCVALGSAPAGWIDWPTFIAGARAPAPPVVTDAATTPALLCWTSGSTGRPKGVLLSQDALAANADASVDMHALCADDRVLTTLPLFHVGGLNIQTTPALRSACSVTLHAKFDPDAAFDAIERDRITLTVLVPAQLEAMIAHARWRDADLSSLRAISTGSTAVPERLIDAVRARGVPLILVWGATETAPIAACERVGAAAHRIGSTGRAALGCALRIVDSHGRDLPSGSSGEILVRGRSVMLGYWRDQPASARALADGWYHSGDRGYLDAEGFLSVDGRLTDMIISGGENINPAEVERVLLDCPEVAEAAVVGRPDQRWGEVIVAVVVPRSGATLTQQQLLTQFDGRLARFKHPKQIFIVDALPRTALGKVRKDELRRLVDADQEPVTAGSEERFG